MNRKHLFLFVFIIFILYFRVLFWQGTYLDDHLLVFDREDFFCDASNINKIFSEPAFGKKLDIPYYRPILNLTFMIECHIRKILPINYHLFNILLHITSAYFLFSLLLKMKYEYNKAFLFTLLFSLHPMLTQSVAWIPGRGETILTIFILLSFAEFINLMERPNYKSFCLHLLFFLLSLFSKENAVVMPLITAFYFYFIKKDKIFYKVLISYFPIILIWHYMRLYAIGGNDFNYFKMFTGIFSNFKMIFYYLDKIILPLNLSAYPYKVKVNYIPGLVLMVLSFFILFKIERKPYFFIGAIWFLLFILPPISITKDGFFEHRIYLPLIGIIFMFINLKLDFNSKIALLFFLYLGIYSFLSYNSISRFKNPESLWQNVISTSSEYINGYLNLSSVYIQNNDLTKASEILKKAIKVNGDIGLIYYNLAIIDIKKKDYDKAEKNLLLSLSKDSSLTYSYFLLAYIYNEKKEYGKSGLYLEKLFAIDSSFLENNDFPLEYKKFIEKVKKRRKYE